jgi:DNA-directed RNA polymerase I subunit RPA49
MTLRTAPLFLVSHHVKALQSSGATASPGWSDYTLARNQLGEAFGTKKARAAIRAAERNKVDVSAMGGGVQDVLQGMIQSNTSTLPQKQEVEKDANDNRPIPRRNDQASSPEGVSDFHPLVCHSHFCVKVYPLEHIISDAELKTISLDKTALDALPFRRSIWLNNNVKRRATKPGKPEKLEL